MTTDHPLTLTPADADKVAKTITDALPDWVFNAPVGDPMYGKWGWFDVDSNQRVELTTWPSWSYSCLELIYVVGGAQRSHLVLRELDQVREYLTPDAEVLS